jgi:DNA-binding NarL/FixJ family response regulator
VLLVGPPDERVRLRARMNGSFVVVGEYDSLGAARAAGVASDAIVVAPTGELRTEELTARELEVLELLAEGLPNKAIAARLGISDQTVKVHVASITGKLGAANRTDAVRRALRRGLITI